MLAVVIFVLVVVVVCLLNNDVLISACVDNLVVAIEPLFETVVCWLVVAFTVHKISFNKKISFLK
jgi:hypothetical protein